MDDSQTSQNLSSYTNSSHYTHYIYGAYGEMLAQYNGASPQYWNVLAGEETIGRRHAGRVSVGKSRAYYLKDHTSTTLSTGLGSVRVTVMEDGTDLGWDACPERSRRDYYPFGLQMEGRTSNTANAHSDQKFTGHFLEQEGDLGVYHAVVWMPCPLTSRYDPETGRFWGVDAMRSEMLEWNTYHYTFNNPVLYLDPEEYRYNVINTSKN